MTVHVSEQSPLELAQLLIDDLEANVIEPGQLDALTLLDCLACLGLRLAPDWEGESSLAYLRELQS